MSSEEGLYVRRNLTAESATALIEWAKTQGFTNLVPEHELHATIVYSRKPIWLKPVGGNIAASTGGRSVEPLGDKGAVVLHLKAPELDGRWEEARQIGASWDHDGYRPHVTISYDAGGMDLSKVVPFTGDLVFGPEIHEPINENWAEEKGFLAECVTLHAMSLNVPNTPGHPNKHPFNGILTRIDVPSDGAPMGSKKRRVIVTRAAAEEALPTLLGMAVDLKSDLSGHDVKKKVGIITEARIEGDAIWIEGFLYAADFPDEVERIKSETGDLGFSWEVRNIFVKDTTADPLVITGCVFTGAAILYKDEAAYTTTQLAAQADKENTTMTQEILDAINGLAAQVGTVTTTLSTVTGRLDKIEASQTETTAAMHAAKEHLEKVEPHAAALESCAAAMETAGIGGHPRIGHVKACRAMADNLRASAAVGKLADSWSGFDGFYAAADTHKTQVDESAELKALRTEMQAMKDQNASLNTKIADMQAAATRNSPAPERKTISTDINRLLARNSISLPDGDKKMSLGEVNKMLANAQLDPQQKMAIKGELQKSGIMEAA